MHEETEISEWRLVAGGGSCHKSMGSPSKNYGFWVSLLPLGGPRFGVLVASVSADYVKCATNGQEGVSPASRIEGTRENRGSRNSQG